MSSINKYKDNLDFFIFKKEYKKPIEEFFDHEALNSIWHVIQYGKEKFKTDRKISIKLNDKRIYVKTPLDNRNTFKIQELYFSTLSKYSAFRKRVKGDIASQQFSRQAEALTKEFEMIQLLQLYAIQERDIPNLERAFLGNPYRLIHKSNGIFYEIPLYAGDVWDLVFTTKLNVTPSQILKAFDSLIGGVAFLQKKGIIHVDIKLENIIYERLENKNFNFRLADFGSVITYEDRLELGEVLTFTYTKDYTPAFEVPYLKNSEDQLHALSSFLLGEALFRTLVKKLPFKKYHTHNYLNMSSSKLDHLSKIGIPESAVQFIKSLLNENPADRPIKSDLYNAWQIAKNGMPEVNFEM